MPRFSRAPQPLLQRKCACGGNPGPSGECENCRKKRLGLVQRSVAHQAPTPAVPSVVHDVLNTPGQPLERGTRGLMESRFGHDFSSVRIHTDSTAGQSARAVSALAYTVGQDIVFGAGQYAPHSPDGQKLIAHELVHTVQQKNHQRGRIAPSRLQMDDPAGPQERESERLSEQVAGGFASTPGTQKLPITAHPAGIQRKVSPDFPKIQDLLKKKVTEDSSHQVLAILKGLSDGDLRDTVAEMEKSKLVDSFFEHLSDIDQRSEYSALQRIKNARVWTSETKDGNTTVTTQVVGSCSPEQFQKISQAATTGAQWLDSAIARLDAYIASPKDAKNADVEAAMKTHFHSTSTDVVQHVRERLAHIRTDIRNTPEMSVECHGTWDKTCDVADAYVPGSNQNLIVFCYSFHQRSADTQAETIVHEMAHAQAGGLHITDRAYEADRLLPLLTTEGALTNAESYGLFARELGTGKKGTVKPPKDTREDCPDDWWQLLTKAIAVAQRWNRNAQVTFTNLMVNDVKGWSKQWQGYIGGTAQADIDRARKTYNRMANKLQSKIDFECEPGGGGRCDDKGTTSYWYAAGDFHICPAWVAQKSEDDRVQSLLSGLYGYVGDVDDNTRRNQYAKLAREINQGWSVPGREDILGSPQKWSPDDISIDVTPQVPKAAKYTYYESGQDHERISQDMPIAQVKAGGTDNFKVLVNYLVDIGSKQRPLPFSPPQLSGLFRFVAPNKGFERKFSDPRPVYHGDGQNLETKFPREQSLRLDENGSLEMRFELKDPDSKVTRVYDDTLQVTVT